MIGRVRGILTWKQPPHLLVETHGVGYEIEAPMSTFYVLPPLGEEISLHTHLVVREDAHLLFGFAGESERALFRLLIKISGIGPRLALAILSGMSTDDFAHAVRHSDTGRLTKLPGVGKKTAERLVIEMRDRLGAMSIARASDPLYTPPTDTFLQHGSPLDDAVSALVALGYKTVEAERMVKGVEAVGLASVEIIRRALQAAAR